MENLDIFVFLKAGAFQPVATVVFQKKTIDSDVESEGKTSRDLPHQGLICPSISLPGHPTNLGH